MGVLGAPLPLSICGVQAPTLIHARATSGDLLHPNSVLLGVVADPMPTLSSDTRGFQRELRKDALGWILLLCEEQGYLINTLLLY